MPNVNELLKFIADHFKMPHNSAVVYARVAREAGLLSQAGYGRAAARAVADDAGALIIALVLSPSPARAADYIRDFGGLVCTQVSLHKKGIEHKPFFDRGQRFVDALSQLIAGLGDREFAMLVARQTLVYEPYEPSFVVQICDSGLVSHIEIGGYETAIYQHEIMYNTDWSKEQDEGQTPLIADALKQRNSAVAKYHRRFKSEKSLYNSSLFPIAEFLNGVSFEALYAAALEDIKRETEGEAPAPTVSPYPGIGSVVKDRPATSDPHHRYEPPIEK